jgi:acyl carrier protein/NADP-dependent 3-hydroxy acid dehydrogenase YdfG
LAVDISQADAVQRMVEEIQNIGMPLRGIIHSAGVNVDGVLTQQSWSDYERVLSPKLAGTWHLHEATLGLDLDFFVLFSSAAALLGSAGQANYAAANGFMDGLAQWRRSLGLPALSVNWGAWQNVGMTAVLTEQDQRRWQQQGLGTFTAAQALALLAQMPTDGAESQIAVLPLNRAKLPTNASIFAELVQVGETAVASTLRQTQSLADKLAAVPPSKRQGVLMTHVRQTVSRILGFGPNHPIADQQPLGEMGIDSLMAVELRNTLGESVDKPLPATLMFDYPTVAALAEYLKQLVSVEGETAVNSEQPPTLDKRAEAVAELEELSDDEAEALLLAELAELNEE